MYTPRGLKKIKVASSTESLTKEPVHVYCRLRPIEDDTEACIKLLSSTTFSLATPADSKAVRKEIHCKFKHIFTAYSSQKEVFDHLAYPLLEDLLRGKNSLLFTYGVTGSGKTYTLTGEQNNPGVMPKCIYALFNSIGDYQAPKYVIKSDKMNGFEVQSHEDAVNDRMNEMKSTGSLGRPKKGSNGRISYVNDGGRIPLVNETNLYSVFITYIEIYNNTVFDLLDESAGKVLQSKILREDAQKNMYVNGVVEVEVKSAEEAFEVFNAGQKRKRMGHTVLNAESSRSHSIFNIRVVQLEQMSVNSEGHPMVPDGNQMKISQLCLVDLAGSERTNRTHATGARLREASSINNSLMSLRTCLEILRENQQTKSNKLVPYRDSRLTLLFKNYFEGEGSVQMIVCINPSADDYDENLHVIKFAEMTQDVKIARSQPRYATPIKKTIEKTPVLTPRIKTPSHKSAFRLLPEVPMVKFDINNPGQFEDAVEKVLQVLTFRRTHSKKVHLEIDSKSQAFRKRLLELSQENVLYKSEFRGLKALAQKARQKTCNTETKIVDLEAENHALTRKNEELETIIQSLRQTISEKDLKINQNILEKEKTKQKLHLQSEKMSQELDAKLRRQRQNMKAQMIAKFDGIKKATQQLCEEIEPMDYVESERSSDQENEPATPATPRRRIVIQEPKQPMERTPGPAALRHRRSRSVGERWLEHNAVKPVALGTVLQPSVKKRKSVTKLKKAGDITHPKQSKYCLIAQEEATDGEMETKVYKADIVPTCMGGAQVIFNDVEKLRQESPTK